VQVDTIPGRNPTENFIHTIEYTEFIRAAAHMHFEYRVTEIKNHQWILNDGECIGWVQGWEPIPEKDFLVLEKYLDLVIVEESNLQKYLSQI
jgi:hypothetical protein